VKNNKVKMGIIPIENSLTGRIGESTELIINSKLKICKEGLLPIVHCLISKNNTSIIKIKKIYAHPEALSQCKNFLKSIKCEAISWYDGAAAADIVKNEKNTALIASKKVADIHSLRIIKRNIQDLKNDITRFFVISKKSQKLTGSDKTSIVFSLKHKPGSLHLALTSFSNENINLTRLESMPLKNKPWEYLFLVDFEGHIENNHVKIALKDLKRHTITMKILGSYPIYYMPKPSNIMEGT